MLSLNTGRKSLKWLMIQVPVSKTHSNHGRTVRYVDASPLQLCGTDTLLYGHGGTTSSRPSLSDYHWIHLAPPSHAMALQRVLFSILEAKTFLTVVLLMPVDLTV